MQSRLNNVAHLCSANLFSDSFPGAQLKVSELEGEHISDVLTEEFIDRLLDEFEWNRPPNLFNAMILVAQTGKGKNFWVLHTLRAYAADRGKEVIYLCNRVALNHQQIQEADKAVNPIKKPNVINDILEHRAGSLTIMTYHRFYKKLKEEGWSYFDRFAFLLDGELRETQTANYFSDVYPIDCTVSPANALFCRKNGTLLQAGNLL